MDPVTLAILLFIGGAAVAIPAIIGASSSPAPAPAPAPPAPAGQDPNQPFPLTAGRRYMVQLLMGVEQLPATFPPLSVAEVLAAFPGAVNVPTDAGQPNAPLNVLAVNVPPSSSAPLPPSTQNYVMDVFVALPPFTAGELASPLTGSTSQLELVVVAGNPAVSVVVAVTDGGPFPAYTMPPAPVGPHWRRATHIEPGERVRMALSAADFAAIVAEQQKAGGTLTDDAAGFLTFMQKTIAPALDATHLRVWAPGDSSLPSDWPTSDQNVATQYHAQFVYGGAHRKDVDKVKSGFRFWTFAHGGSGVAHAAFP